MPRIPSSVIATVICACFAATVASGQTATPPGSAAKPAVQSTRPAEATPQVPELDAMHEVIMPMWHDAWPNKDYKALAGMLPGIQKHMTAIASAKLPGILVEKTGAWKAGVADLQKAADGYKAAVASTRNEDLLKAAETLHMQYEKLVRVIKPALPALDDFHGVLYVLYHKHTKPLVLAKVTESVALLQAKMGELNKATLPANLKGKTEAFTAQRTALDKSLTALATTIATKDAAKITAAIESMHGEYQKLEKVFE